MDEVTGKGWISDPRGNPALAEIEQFRKNKEILEKHSWKDFFISVLPNNVLGTGLIGHWLKCINQTNQTKPCNNVVASQVNMQKQRNEKK